ncbi:hypothetical protein ES705_27453 [subsurface metagenome]
MQRIMDKSGLDRDRLQLVWISAAEGQKFQEKIKELKKKLESVSIEEINKGRIFFRDRERKRERDREKKREQRSRKDKVEI